MHSFVSSSAFTVYNMRTNSWSNLTSAPAPRYRYSAAAVGDNIYYVGGRDVEENLVSNIDVFSISLQSWRTVDLSPSANNEAHLRSDGASWVEGAKLYIVGGYNWNYSVVLDSVIVMDTKNDTAGFSSEGVAPKPTAAGDLAALFVDGKAYVIGGIGADFCAPYGTTEVYDSATNTWTTLSSLKHARADSAYAQIDKIIFVLGGETKAAGCADHVNTKSFPVNDVEAFDTENPGKGWYEVDDLAIKRFRFAASASVAQNFLFTFGGQGTIVEPADAPANAAEDPNNMQGYYPVLKDVYALNLTALAEANANINAATTAMTSNSLVVMAVAALAALLAAF
jgi:N-acetylneuraminic acid mutarotase